MDTRTRNLGFTLVELMITVTVLVVLLVLAVPSFERFFERYRLRSAVDDALDLFAAARQGAVEADRNVNVTFGSSTTAWCAGAVQQAEPASAGDVVPLAPTACDCSAAPASCTVGGQQLTISDGGRGVTIGAGGTSVTFDSKNGTLDPLGSQSVNFVSPHGRYGLTVTITPLGQARACVTSGKLPIPGYSPC